MNEETNLQELLADVRAYLEYAGHVGVTELPLSVSKGPPTARDGSGSQGLRHARGLEGSASTAPAPALPRFVSVGSSQTAASPTVSAQQQASSRFGPMSPQRFGPLPSAITGVSAESGDKAPVEAPDGSERSSPEGRGVVSAEGRGIPRGDRLLSRAGSRAPESVSSRQIADRLEEIRPGGRVEPLTGVTDDSDELSGQTNLLASVVRQRPRIDQSIEAPFVSAVPADRAGAIAEVRRELGECTRCPLAGGRCHIVFGAGNPEARVMFIGAAPTVLEDARGEPFVGEEGALLDRIIDTMLKLRRDDVYLANVVMCMPPGGRETTPEEEATCGVFLTRQIEVVRPRIIVTLGVHASRALLQTSVPLPKLRGHWYRFRGIPVLPTFHPGALLADPAKKRPVRDDMLLVKSALDGQES